MTPTLAEAIAEVTRKPDADFDLDAIPWSVFSTILNAAASGELIPRTDNELAVALAYDRIAREVGRWSLAAEEAILALAPAEPLAEVQALKAERDELRERVRMLSFMGEGYMFVERRAEAAEAEVARLTALLVSDREELLWSAYHTGHEKDGQWDHCCMSDGEWLARECGFEADQRVYPADAIKAAIPGVAARAALTTPEIDATDRDRPASERNMG